MLERAIKEVECALILVDVEVLRPLAHVPQMHLVALVA